MALPPYMLEPSASSNVDALVSGRLPQLTVELLKTSVRESEFLCGTVVLRPLQEVGPGTIRISAYLREHVEIRDGGIIRRGHKRCVVASSQMDIQSHMSPLFVYRLAFSLPISGDLASGRCKCPEESHTHMSLPPSVESPSGTQFPRVSLQYYVQATILQPYLSGFAYFTLVPSASLLWQLQCLGGPEEGKATRVSTSAKPLVSALISSNKLRVSGNPVVHVSLPSTLRKVPLFVEIVGPSFQPGKKTCFLRSSIYKLTHCSGPNFLDNWCVSHNSMTSRSLVKRSRSVIDLHLTSSSFVIPASYSFGVPGYEPTPTYYSCLTAMTYILVFEIRILNSIASISLPLLVLGETLPAYAEC